MKLTFFLVTLFTIQSYATVFSQNLNLVVKQAPLEEVIRELRKQSGYAFFYDKDYLKKAKPVTLRLQNANIEEALQQVFDQQPFTFQIVEKTIVVKDKEPQEVKKVEAHLVTGKVSDEQGIALIGVTVKVKGTGLGTTTDVNGNFSINVPDNGILVFSYLGFAPQEIKVGQQTRIEVTLKEDAARLNEVVITGYSSAARKDLTGAIGTVNMEDLQKAPVRSFEEALAGRVAGVQVSSNDGKPGSGINILIRGVGSLTQSTAPLWVIDGLAIESPDNDLLDPANVESITVLKDASSTALYGARGSNGVIVVMTKRGKKGAARVNYAGNYGVNEPIRYMKLLSPYEFVKVISEHSGAAFNPYLINGLTLEDYRYVKASDWQSQMFRTAPQQNHSVSVSGGSEGTLYSASANFLDQQGIIINSGYRRYLGKLTLDQTVGKRAKIGGFLSYASGKVTGTNPTGNGANALFYHAFTYRAIPLPDVSSEEFEEELYDPSNNNVNDHRVNPILSAKNEIRNSTNNNLLANLYVDYNILKNLKLSLKGSLNSSVVRDENFNGRDTRSGGPNGTNGVNGSLFDTKVNVFDNTNLLEYNTTIQSKHRLTAFLGTSIQKRNYNRFGYSATQIPDEVLGLGGLDAGVVGSTPAAQISESALTSIFGSVNYIFNNKYYITANFRDDGSSKFADNLRRGFFPSAAIKWKLSEEKFFKNLSFLSDGNIRLSYGETGNNRVGDFARFGPIQYQNPLSLNGTLQGNSAVVTALGNSDLHWETSKSTDLGFDFGFFKNRLNLVVDLYDRRTNDLLYTASLPRSTGYPSVIKNIASISNRGLEITLSGDILKKRNVQLSSSFNISFNRNKLRALADPSEEALLSNVNWEAAYSNIPAFISKIGGPLGQIYGLVSDGLYQYADFDQLPSGAWVLKPEVHSKLTSSATDRTQTQPGDPKHIDINNDGQINEHDRTVIGNGYPLHVGGWNNNLKVKDFDFGIFFQWSYGNDVINANRLWFDQGIGIKERSANLPAQNTFAAYADRWTPENQDTDIPKMNRAIVGQYNSNFVEDGSYLRLKTLNVGYTVPSRYLSKAKISRLRVYVATNNIFTLTKYKGYDPEVSAFRNALVPSFDYSAYPRPLTVTAGLNLTL